MKRWNSILSALACLFIVVSADTTALGQASEESRKQIEARLEQRYPEILTAKTAGKIGETWQGYLELVKVDPNGKAGIEELVRQENVDRRMLYEVIAAETSTNEVKVNADEVGQKSGSRSFRRAKPQEYFKTREGVWIQRDDVNELKAAGKIGETWKGLVEAVKSEFASDRQVTAVVAMENRLRSDKYAYQARKEGVTAEKLAEQEGENAWASLPKGQWFRNRDGKWVQK